MDDKTISVDVTSSWEPGNQKSLKDAVTLTPLTGYNRNVDGVLTDMVDLDSCILLSQPSEENGNQDAGFQSCSITLRMKSKSPHIIQSLVVVSEARIIEVYGKYDEYLSTVSADCLDEMDDMVVYCAEIQQPQIAEECTLKFARLRDASEMWLYGIKVIWNIQNICKETFSPKSSVNFETVEQRLKESHTPLSNRAENCKQFLKMYSSLSSEKDPCPSIIDPLSLLSLLPAGRKKANLLDSPVLRSVAQSYANGTIATISGVSNERGQPQNQATSEENEVCCKKCTENIEIILDKKFMLMENRLLKALDDKMAALQHHQERQIENLLYLVLKNGASTSKMSAPKQSNSIASDNDLKVEQVIKKMEQRGFCQTAPSSEANYLRNTCDGSKDKDILRNAFLAMELNGMFTESSHPAGLEDRGGGAAVHNSS